MYVGDGQGDVCPCLYLGERCFAVVRHESVLHTQLLSANIGFTGRVVAWKNGQELRDTLLHTCANAAMR